MKLLDGTLPAAKSGSWRTFGLLSLALALLLAVACGPGAEPEAESPAAPTAAVVTNPLATESAVAAPAPATENVAASVRTETDKEESVPAAAASTESEPAEPAPEPTAAADAKPDPTATPSLSDLAALVEANPPAEPAEPEPEPTAAMERKRAEGPLAAEPVGITGWINSDPLTLEQLKGKVVLVDFWTYTCVNCIRTFPYLKLWHSRYADDGLVILGIHTPEFEFEKDYYNVLEATEENGIAWPVAQDNDFETWNAYSNRFWPAKYLIDQDGVIRYDHFGEGKYAETEQEIRKLLLEAGADLSDDMEFPEDQSLDPAFLNTMEAVVTPELYAGYHRNVNSIFAGRRPYVIQEVYYQSADSVGNFVAPVDLEPHFIFFHGTWEVGQEHVRHGRATQHHEDFLSLRYSAKSVNAVLTSHSGEPYRVRIILDGEYLTDENKGADIHIAEDGESYLMVDQPRLYEIIDSPTYTQEQELRMSSNSPNFGLFAFTFGVYSEGP